MAVYTIRVVDSQGSPIEGAEVIASGGRVSIDSVTDANGEVSEKLSSFSKRVRAAIQIMYKTGEMGTSGMTMKPDEVLEVEV